MSKVKTFDDGTLYIERPGTRWCRVKVSTEPFVDQTKTLEVCYIAVNDITPPPSPGKGSTMRMDRSWFDYLDQAHNHTSAASNWMRTPFMLWFNRNYIGDPTGATTGDPEPVLECITGSGNILRIIGETASHYEIWALPLDSKPSQFNPAVYNFKHYPWVFWKAQARTRDGVLQRVGAGLDVYHINFRKPGNRHWIHKSQVQLLQQTPFTLNGVTIIDYQFVGRDVYGITAAYDRVPLLINGQHLTQWNSGQVVV